MSSNSLKAARRFLTNCPAAISGHGGDRKTFFVAASLVRRFSLDEQTALTLMMEWNQRCVPPWPENELRRKIRAAAQQSMTAHHASARGGASKPQRPIFREMVLKRIAGKTHNGIVDIKRHLRTVSPISVDQMDSAGFLEHLYRPGSGEKVLLLSSMRSQGQAFWVADQGAVRQRVKIPAGPDGVWFLPQPVTGEYHPNPRQMGKPSRRSEEAVTAWRYAVLESDEADPDDWLRCLAQLPLRIASICESGGRSIHALVRIDATSKADWDAQVGAMKSALVTLGADPAALTAVRLTRLPQAMHGERRQTLLYLDPNPRGSAIIDV